MTQTILKLKKVKNIGHLHIEDSDLKDLEEGDMVGSYKVIEVEKQECKHPERTWRLDEDCSEDPPTMTGHCRVCGHEKTIEPES